MITWQLVDHLCSKCGGRILKSVSGVGMSPGGNPLFRCADCGENCFGLSPSNICWCGMKQKFQSFPAYTCMPYSILKDNPELFGNFMSCGCDPKKGGEVGIIIRKEKP